MLKRGLSKKIYVVGYGHNNDLGHWVYKDKKFLFKINKNLNINLNNKETMTKYTEKQKEQIDKIDTCVEDKATQIYEMSKQYEKLVDENYLLKKEIKTLKDKN